MANCESKPFMKLQDNNSNAPILNYNLEQENCLSLTTNVEIPIDQSLFKVVSIPIPAVYTLKDLEPSVIKEKILEDIKKNQSLYFLGFNLVQNSTLPVVFYEASPNAQPYQPLTQAQMNNPFPTLPATPMSRFEPLYNNTKGAWSFVQAIKGNNSYAKFDKVQVCIDEPYLGKVSNNEQVIIGGESISVLTPVENNAGLYLWETRIVGYKDTVQFPQDAVIDFEIMDIVANIKLGRIPKFVARPMGKIDIEYTEYSETVTMNRQLYIQYETMLCSYLGNYGAGRTINTFSLLPGEKTTISVRTYRDSVRSNSLSENILDSMSEASSNSLQNAFESQNGTESAENSSSSSGSSSSAGSSSGVGFSSTSNSHWNVGGGGGLNLGFFSFGGSAGGGGSSSSSTGVNINNSNSTSNTNVKNSAIHTSTIANVVNSGLSQHVSESNKHRDVNINTTTTNTETSGEENSVVRELHNVNLSRTLNFVFRQLQQEHIVIHWLKNIKFRFYDPNTGESRLVFSQSLPMMLYEVLVDKAAVDEVFGAIMNSVGVVFNHQEDPFQFFESRQFNTQPQSNSCDGITLSPRSECLWLRVRNIEDTYANITVPGVILGVQKHILRTPSVIVDSLLGQGEALDCYNMNLQEKEIELKTEEVKENQLRNQLMTDSILSLTQITDPVQRAEAYKNMFVEPKCCCDGQG